MRKNYSELSPEQKASQVAASQRWRERNKSAAEVYQKEYGAKYRADHKAEMAVYQKAWRARNKIKLAGLLRNYGLSIAQYNAMLLAQGGRCAICGTDKPKGNGKRLQVDHNHETGKVRALLCLKCNTSLGWLERLQSRAMDYLLKHSGTVQ